MVPVWYAGLDVAAVSLPTHEPHIQPVADGVGIPLETAQAQAAAGRSPA